MTTTSNIFVFVVCGAAEHIHTLHYALKALQKYTQYAVWVVTDSRRNEIPVQHSTVIDITTPQGYSHHQASIYLKTGLHRFLPAGNTYCYLDTDVVAIRPCVDEIFTQYIPPITFAPDHCVLNEFSPWAAQCSCKADFDASVQQYHDLYKQYNETLRHQYEAIQKHISGKTAYNKRNPLVYAWHVLRYHLPGRYYVLDKHYKLEKKTQRWLNHNGEYIEEKYGFHSVYKKHMNLDWSWEHNTFVRPDGRPFFELTCNHLADNIALTFQVQITQPHWQHWNGGVFLFNDRSHPFLEFWHQATLRIFTLPEWKTRDQGTLAATVWHFGLQHQPTLDVRYNYIADYSSHNWKYLGNLQFDHERWGKVSPCFIHIFHHFGDAAWKVWQDVDVNVNNGR